MHDLARILTGTASITYDTLSCISLSVFDNHSMISVSEAYKYLCECILICLF